MVIDLIAGARPNFIKIAPIINAIKKRKFLSNLSYRLIHTGQHYDNNMSESFFNQLNIPKPDYNLKSGSGSQAEQTAKIMIEYEKLLSKNKIDLCLVVGDVNSTMACAIVAKKLNIKVAHVEAGIRSNDLSMPEEINRMVTDSITDYFFTTSDFANDNLKKSGINPSNIFFVGNTMIDTLILHRKNFYPPKVWKEKSLLKDKYLLITMHRPSNVDLQNKLRDTLTAICKYSRKMPIIFPTHPRTKIILEQIGISFPNLILTPPLSYLEFNYLVMNSKAVITDSGGISEETTVLGIPCLTLRDNTERPETVDIGTNLLVGTNPKKIKQALDILFDLEWKKGVIPNMWDGKTSERIVNHILSIPELNT
tara:strand:+ start:1198 stop:2295 length:1098 start_codon:yes stop_codon:yes gene_type:complete